MEDRPNSHLKQAKFLKALKSYIVDDGFRRKNFAAPKIITYAAIFASVASIFGGSETKARDILFLDHKKRTEVCSTLRPRLKQDHGWTGIQMCNKKEGKKERGIEVQQYSKQNSEPWPDRVAKATYREMEI